MKRIISAILFFTLLLGTVMPTLTACSDAVGSDKYTVGEWLKKVNEMFCLTYYTQSEPLVNGVSADNEYYSAVQIAADWGVIDEGSTIKVKDKITREFCADTLVRAMDFDYDTNPNIKDSEKLSCLRTVGIALNEGIMKLDNGGKFNPTKKVSRTDADIALLTAYDKWINLSYEGDEYFEAEVKDGVVNIGGLSEELSPVSCRPDDFSVSYSKKTITFDENGQMVDDIDKTVTFKNRDAMPAGVQVGTVMTLPADDVMPTSYCVKVTGITDNPDGTVTLVTSNAELFDAYDHFEIRDSQQVDFSNAVVFDTDGNRLELTEDLSADDMFYDGDEMVYREGLYCPSSYEFLDTKTKRKDKVSTTYNVGDILSLKLSIDEKGVYVKTKVSSGKDGLTFSHEASMTNLSVHKNLDIGWFKIKKFRMVAQCDTSNKVTISAKKDISGKKTKYYNDPDGTKEIRDGFAQGVIEGLEEKNDEDYVGFDKGTRVATDYLKNLYTEATTDIKDAKALYTDAKNAFSTRLLNVVIPSGTGFDLTFIVSAKLSLSGEIYISIDTTESFGAELVKGKLRDVRSHEVTKEECGFEAKAEFTLYGGLGVSALGCLAADIGIEGGIGAKASSKLYATNSATLATEAECALPVCFLPIPMPLSGGTITNVSASINDYPLSDDIACCTDFKVYPIVKLICCSDNSLVGKWIYKLEVIFLDEENPFFNIHCEVDNGAIDQMRTVDKCTREVQSGYKIETGKELTLSHSVLPVALGDDGKTNDLKVVTIPKGYKVTDLEMISEDDTIASIKNLLHIEKDKSKGWRVKITRFGQSETTYYQDLTEVGDEAHSEIEGKKDGITMVTVRTKDGKYSAQVKLVVGNGGFGDAIIGSLMPATYAYSLDPGTTAKIELGALPGDYKPQDIVYSSQDTAVATVSASGVITAVADGMTSINIATSDGAYKTAVSVFVYVGAAAANADTSGGSAGDSAENYTAGGGGSASESGGDGAFGGGSGGGTRGEAGGGSGGGGGGAR